MSTAEKKTGQLGSWANLVICGGLSWGVNFWHATHTASAGAHVGTALALLCATGPVFSAGFASHNMSRSGGGGFKKFLTYVVFAMGMALSITAQAEAVTAVFGNIYLGVTFALMLDLSAFMSLHSIMSASSVDTTQAVRDTVSDTIQNTVADTIPTVSSTVSNTTADTVQDTATDTVENTTADTTPTRARKPAKRRGAPVSRHELARRIYDEHMTEHGAEPAIAELMRQLKDAGHPTGNKTAASLLDDIRRNPLRLAQAQ